MLTVEMLRPNRVIRSLKRRVRYNLHPRAIIWKYLKRSSPDKPIIATLNGGLKVRICPHDVIGKYIYIDGVFEPDCWNFIKKFLKPGMVLFDLGANLGQYTLLAAKCVGAQGRVHSFEPCSNMFRELEFNVKLNGFLDVCVLNCLAVCDTCGTAKLSRYPEGAEVYASLGSHQRREATIIGYEEVKTVTLDDYIAQHRVDRVDFMKMDIEGSELLALRGAESLLSRSDAPVILLELSDVNAAGFGYNALETWDYLNDFGYRMYSINKIGEVFEMIRPPKRFFPARNLVAMKSSLQKD